MTLAWVSLIAAFGGALIIALDEARSPAEDVDHELACLADFHVEMRFSD